jgi:hypothetical protein
MKREPKPRQITKDLLKQSNRWNDVKSINQLQLNVGRMSDTELLQELKSDPVLSNTFQKIIPQLENSNEM